MKTVEIALKAGRLRLSPTTQFIHDPTRELIPVYENFCFALTLFRTKMSENVLEGKALLERLFAFQTVEGFPIHLHEYPAVKSRKLAQKLSVVAHFLLRDFAPVLGEDLRGKLQSIVVPLDPIDPKTPEEWADFLIRSENVPSIHIWDPVALCYTGAQKQDRGEPSVTLLDLLMGEWTGNYSKRALQDHPSHVQASLIYPKQVHVEMPPKLWSRRFWGQGSPTYSALLHADGAANEHGETITIDLPEKEVHDEVEVSYFLNRAPDASFTVGGVKATTFQPGDTVEVQSGNLTFEMRFEVEGGRFWGHINFGNRPGQMASTKFDAFDWKIALRTIERTKAARIKIVFRLK